MSRKRQIPVSPELVALRDCLDEFAGRYEKLKPGAPTFGDYVGTRTVNPDEETLTEQVLGRIIERVLGFPSDAYFPQLGKGGLKPDFTPIDLIAHPFVLDAKGSNESNTSHVRQIQRYVGQRSLQFGVLFNLRDVHVFPRGSTKHDRGLSFPLLPLWQVARGEALPGPEAEAFERFCLAFSFRELDVQAKVDHIRHQPSWAKRLAEGEDVAVDVEFLVEQLRLLASELVRDAGVSQGELDRYLAAAAGRDERLIHELKQLALDLEPGADLEALPDAVADWRVAGGLAERVWHQYLLRVAYLSLTRIMLYRAWEDVQFVDEALYDGGFDAVYTQLDENVRDVLRRAMTFGAERYRTLFLAENNYEWYVPSEPVLVEVLYRLGSVPLGRLDQDALGALYVSYVDEIDRDRLGQFFTPRDVVRFMLDRAGFVGPDALFRVEGDRRVPLRIFDFATGSGGFLVEAARRIIDDSGIDDDDVAGLGEALAAITRGFYGGEISPFPYYLTEINLLLQISRLLGKLKLQHVDPPSFVTGVLRTDSLATKSAGSRSLDVAPELRGDTAELVDDDIYDVVPVESEKQGAYREVKQDAAFDLVIGNPPYVAEANNKPLFEHLRAIPTWRGVYRGKTDYLYYFLLLAVEKLKPGGKLCVIVPAGWMNAGNADFLRERLASELTLEELFLFGSYKLFAADQGPAPTPTVESAILVATKAPAPKRHKLRVVALEDESGIGSMTRAELLAELAKRLTGRAARRGGIHAHSVPQVDLRPEYPWAVKFGIRDVQTRVVAALSTRLTEPGSSVVPLSDDWRVFQGIQTGADAYTSRISKRLGAAERAELHRREVSIGDPILEIPANESRNPPWRDHPAVLAKSPEPTGVLYAAIDDDYTYLIVVRDAPPKAVLDHLERYKPILATRAEIARNERRKWWEAAWPRSPRDMSAPKVIALYRTDRGRFALDESGEWQPSIKSTIVVGRDETAPVAYLCGLLNSELLDLWYAVRGKTPRDVWRNYEPKRMNEMPYRRPEGDPRADEIAELVREIAANRRALLPHRAVVRDLGRIVKDPWKTGPVAIDRRAFLNTLPTKDLVSVRLDRDLEIDGRPAGKGSRLDERTLVFRRGGKETGRVVGDSARIDLLADLVGDRVSDDVPGLLVPKNMASFEEAAKESVVEVERLLAEGRAKVEQVERLVCALYGLPDDLIDDVVEHAVARAAR
jgi:N-6 DNA Methylase/Eco57I restriction-modification methylase